MPTTVQRWGNSLGVRIPKALAEQAMLVEGAEVEFEASRGRLTLRRRHKKRREPLSALLRRFKPRHKHGELRPDGPRGGELI